MPVNFTASERAQFIQAIEMGDYDIVRDVLKDGLSPDVMSDRSSALAAAARQQDIKMMELLLGAGANLNLRMSRKMLDGPGVTALNVAVSRGKYKSVNWLLEKGASPCMVNVAGDTAAHILLASISHLPPEAPLDFTVRALEQMLDLGVPVNQRSGPATGDTLLHVACTHFNVPNTVLDLLIKRGADVGAFSANGVAPIHRATETIRVAQLEFLLKSGVSADSLNSQNRTPLHLAFNPDVVDTLIRAGANLEVRDVEGRTPLAHHLNQSSPQAEVAYSVRRLIEAGADLDARDLEGVTPRDIIRTRRLKAVRAMVGAVEARVAMSQANTRFLKQIGYGA